MNSKQKIALALSLLDRHARVYKTTVPKRLYELWSKGEALSASGKVLRAGMDEWEGTVRVIAAIPSWEVQGQIGGVDDAVVGPNGEWEGAARAVPLFHCEQSRYYVARIDDPKCPVGYFEEETFQDDGDGYKEGVRMVTKSLDAFLEALDAADEADVEVSDDPEESWDEVDEVLGATDEATEEVGADAPAGAKTPIIFAKLVTGPSESAPKKPAKKTAPKKAAKKPAKKAAKKAARKPAKKAARKPAKKATKKKPAKRR